MILLLLLIVVPAVAFACGYQLGRVKATTEAIDILQEHYDQGLL
jgi:uncharacterized membrane protein